MKEVRLTNVLFSSNLKSYKRREKMSQQEHGFANPSPQALTALSIACFIFFGLLTGRIGADSHLAVAIWLLGGFVAQFTAGVIELKEGNITGGNVMLLFGAFFMFVTGLLNAAEFICHANDIHWSATCDPYAWLCLSIILTVITPAYLVGSPVFLAALIFADIALWFLTLMKFKAVNPFFAAPIAAYCLLILGVLGLYLAAATVLNTVFKKAILPTGKAIVVVD
jgi:succinate-acetate transporter protein